MLWNVYSQTCSFTAGSLFRSCSSLVFGWIKSNQTPHRVTKSVYNTSDPSLIGRSWCVRSSRPSWVRRDGDRAPPQLFTATFCFFVSLSPTRVQTYRQIFPWLAPVTYYFPPHFLLEASRQITVMVHAEDCVASSRTRVSGRRAAESALTSTKTNGWNIFNPCYF